MTDRDITTPGTHLLPEPRRPGRAMGTGRTIRAGLIAILPLAVLLSTSARAEEPKEPEAPLPPWAGSAELSVVVTAGNSETTTIGFKSTVLRRWEKTALLTLKAGAIRAEATTTDPTATGTPSDFEVHEHAESETTAENYFLNAQYDRKITDFLVWFVGAGWDRNEPSGIKNRYVLAAGLGNIWVDTDRVKFKTNYGLTGTKQDDVIENPDANDTFLGARVSYDYLHKFGQSTVYTSSLIVDDNLDETSDWRADMINAVSVAMSKRLALKASLQWLYDNEPSLIEVPFDPPLGPGQPDHVLFEADDLDTIFTTSLVINF